MLKKNNGQLDMFDYIIFERLIPKDHLLVKISSILDFSFIYEKVKNQYSHLGRGSKDPVMMVKILLLEYLYNLSDIQITERIKTDIAFRWFLELGINDPVPDDTTISHFRVNRLGEENYEEFFNEIVRKCIDKDLIMTKRYIIDTTDVAANVNYPSEKKLIKNAYIKVINEIEKFNEALAKEQLKQFELELDQEYERNENVNVKKHLEIAKKHIEYIYLETYTELQNNQKYQEAYSVFYDIIHQYINNTKDKIVSVVDPDARVAHKSVGNIKRGYKNHIIVDEDSEIILASEQTPFNVGDEKKLQDLIEKVENNFEMKPDEVSADKVYGTIENRAYLKDNGITTNIAFYKESSREVNCFGIRDFKISEDITAVTCPNGVISHDYKIRIEKRINRKFKEFNFDKKSCECCSLRNQCLAKNKDGKFRTRSRRLFVSLRYDAIQNDLNRTETEEFNKAYNNRYKIERRFATMVRNHGLRRCRYTRLKRAKIHIIMVNMVCNIIRMVNLLLKPSVSMP